MSKRLPAIAAPVAAITASLQTIAADTKPELLLDAPRILSQVVGHTIVFQDDAHDRVEEYLSEDGTVRGRSRTNGLYETEWQIRFGHYLCLVSSDPMQSGCVQVSLQPSSKITFYLDIGETEGPFAILPGNPGRL
jgi:hypothetical protein